MQYELEKSDELKSSEKENVEKFSYFSAPITSTSPTKDITLAELYYEVTYNQELFKNTIHCKFHNLNSDKSIYSDFKIKNLPSVTPSGSFTKRGMKNFKVHSGYICLDIDNLDSFKKADDLKHKLSKDEILNPVLIFISPSGRGLKIFLKIDIESGSHLEYFESLYVYLDNVYIIEIDKSCKDISRACFLAYDENAFYRADYLKVSPLGKFFIQKHLKHEVCEKNTTNIGETKPDSEVKSELKDLGLILKNKSICLTDKYVDWIQVGYALCELGENGRSLFHLFSGTSVKYDYDYCNSKYDDLLASYDNKVGVATLFYKIQKAGVSIGVKPFIKPKNGIRTASQRLKDAMMLPDILPMMGAIWQKGELHILFGDTGCGKSILAIQMANALTSGEPLFKVIPNATSAQKVLIYDFELSDRQFLKRYSNNEGKSFGFNDNFILGEISFKDLLTNNPGCKMDNLIFQQIRNDIQNVNPSILVVDNLTFLSTQTAQETSAALDLMRELDSIKKEFNISILVLAHTPKVKRGTPLTINELGGSKMISNFSDSVSCIGKSSKGKDV